MLHLLLPADTEVLAGFHWPRCVLSISSSTGHNAVRTGTISCSLFETCIENVLPRGPDLQLANLLCKSSMTGETLSNAFVKLPPLRIVYWDHRNPLAVLEALGCRPRRQRWICLKIMVFQYGDVDVEVLRNNFLVPSPSVASPASLWCGFAQCLPNLPEHALPLAEGTCQHSSACKFQRLTSSTKKEKKHGEAMLTSMNLRESYHAISSSHYEISYNSNHLQKIPDSTPRSPPTHLQKQLVSFLSCCKGHTRTKGKQKNTILRDQLK